MNTADTSSAAFSPDTFELDFDSPIGDLEDLLFRCRFSEEYVETIREIAETRMPRAIAVLASLLDSTDPIAEAAIEGLLSYGADAIPAMRACVDSCDADMIRHGHVVLAELGDAESVRWLKADDHERAEAYLDEMGFLDLDDEDGDAVDESTSTANDDAKPSKSPAA
jgi:hypothetical protein